MGYQGSYQPITIYGYHPTLSRRRRRRKTPLFLLVFIILGMFFMTNFFFRKISAQTPESGNFTIVSPLPESEIASTSGQVIEATIEPSQPVVSTNLSQIVKDGLSDSKGTYAVYIKNLKTGEQVAIDENKVFQSASLYKLWTMAAVFQEIEKGTLSEEDVLHDEIATLNKRFKISTDAAELTEGEITMSVKKALEQMITISHNYAALLLTTKVKLATVKTFLEDQNLSNSKVGSPPKTTARDIAKYYEQLYNGQIINREYSDKMIDLLSRQRLNDRIPKYLPEGIRVAHKTGELDMVKHDAGIVYSPNGDYIFVVLSETPRPADAAEKTAKLSEKVYNYFNPKTQ